MCIKMCSSFAGFISIPRINCYVICLLNINVVKSHGKNKIN